MQKGTQEVVWQGKTWNSAEDIICTAQQWWWHTAGHNPQQPLAGAQTLQKDWWGLSLGQLSVLLFTCQKKPEEYQVWLYYMALGVTIKSMRHREFSPQPAGDPQMLRPTTSRVAGVENKYYLFIYFTLRLSSKTDDFWEQIGSPLKSGSKVFLLTGCAN